MSYNRDKSLKIECGILERRYLEYDVGFYESKYFEGRKAELAERLGFGRYHFDEKATEVFV